MRRFEMSEGTSSKFWEVSVDGNKVTVRFGRIGTDGQTKTKAAASPDAAQKEADKLVREKTGKGYTETSAAKPKSTSAGPKPAPAAKTAPAAKAAKTAPAAAGASSFSAELDALYAKGWPHLRTLTDQPVTPAKATAEALKGLEAVDPYFPTTIPRETARRYLRGYVWKPYTPEIKKQVAADEGPIDARWLAEVLEKKCGPTKSVEYGGETYDFRLAEVMFLFEAFLGTELVAEAIISHLVRARDNVKWWGSFVDHDNQVAARLIDVVGWMRLRMPAAKWKKLVAPLAASKAKLLADYCALLCQLAEDDVPTENLDLLLQRRSVAEAKKYFAEHPREWFHDPQLFFVIGKDELLKFDTRNVKQLAKWQQLRLIDEMGTIQGPGAVRLITALAESKAAAPSAASWLEAHGGKAPPPVPKANTRELEKEVRAIFPGIEKLLLAGKGDPKKERQVMDAAFARYAELRAAIGEVSPEAYFTHAFADVTRKWKADEATTKRWLDLAVEAAGG